MRTSPVHTFVFFIHVQYERICGKPHRPAPHHPTILYMSKRNENFSYIFGNDRDSADCNRVQWIEWIDRRWTDGQTDEGVDGLRLRPQT